MPGINGVADVVLLYLLFVGLDGLLQVVDVLKLNVELVLEVFDLGKVVFGK